MPLPAGAGPGRQAGGHEGPVSRRAIFCCCGKGLARPRAERQPCGDVTPAGATRCSLPCGFPARCGHKGMACVGVRRRGESAEMSATGNQSQRVPESPSWGRGAVGDVCPHLVLGHRGAEERGLPHIPSLEEVGLCRVGQGESPGMLFLHGGPQSSGDFIRSPSQQQGSLHQHVLMSKAVTVLDEGTTFISPSSQCLHEHSPIASGHRPCTAPLPHLPSKAPSREARGRAWKEDFPADRKAGILEGHCSALVGGERQGGGAGQGPAIPLQALSLRRSNPWRALAVRLPAGRSQLRAIRVEAEKAPL